MVRVAMDRIELLAYIIAFTGPVAIGLAIAAWVGAIRGGCP